MCCAIKQMTPFVVPTLLMRKLRLGELKELRGHSSQVGRVRDWCLRSQSLCTTCPQSNHQALPLCVSILTLRGPGDFLNLVSMESPQRPFRQRGLFNGSGRTPPSSLRCWTSPWNSKATDCLTSANVQDSSVMSEENCNRIQTGMIGVQRVSTLIWTCVWGALDLPVSVSPLASKPE